MAGEPEQKAAAGWYEYDGSLRRWTGERWADDYAPMPTAPPAQRSVLESIGVVALGVVLGLLLFRLVAELDPDTIFLPIKFLVEDLAPGLISQAG